MSRKSPATALSFAIAIALALRPDAALVSPLETGYGVAQAVAPQAAKKTNRQHVNFMPKSYGKENNVAGCRAKIIKKAFKLTGKPHRAVKLAAPRNSAGVKGAKLLSKKTRTHKVAGRVTF